MRWQQAATGLLALFVVGTTGAAAPRPAAAAYPAEVGMTIVRTGESRLAERAAITSRMEERIPAPAPEPTIGPELFPMLQGEQLDFLLRAIEPARESQRNTGVPASVTLAQAILESNWGRSTVSSANNYFGIKATRGAGPAGVVYANTREFENGRWITIQAPFRAYNNMEESFTDHGRFLAESPRYAPAFQVKHDAREFARAIHRAGYATDPGYSDKLIRIMDQYDLYRFDVK